MTDPSEVFNEASVPETRVLVLLSTEEREVSTRPSSALTSAWVAAWVAAALAWTFPTAVLMVVIVLPRTVASWVLSWFWAEPALFGQGQLLLRYSMSTTCSYTVLVQYL